MPDIGTWRRNALQILPHYRQAAERLLVQDTHGSDQEKNYQAQRWLADLKMDVPGNANEPPGPRRRSTPSLSSAPGGIANAVNDSTFTGEQTASVLPPSRASDDRPPAPAATTSAPPQPLAAAPVRPTPLPSTPPPSALPASPPSALPPYNGAKSGTLESAGGPIAQNAEYVFRNLPLVKIQLDYDTKTWDARLLPGEGQTQKLILKNKSSGPQKRCVVHWTVIPE